MLKCVQDTPRLTVTVIDTFFTRHLQNRAAATATGGATLWDHAGASQALALILQTASVANPTPGLYRSNSNSGNFGGGNSNNTRGGFHNNRGNFRGRGSQQGYRGRGARGGGPQNQQNRQVTRTFPVLGAPLLNFSHTCRTWSRPSGSAPSVSATTKGGTAPTARGSGAPSPGRAKSSGTSAPSPCQAGRRARGLTPPLSTSELRDLF